MDLNLLFIAYARFDNIQKNLDNLNLDLFNEIYVYIDGPKNDELRDKQIDFYNSKSNKIKVFLHKKNMGVRKFIPYSISEAFKHSENLLILEDDVLVNNCSLDFIFANGTILKENIISLFNPVQIENNIITYDGGIWGWSVSKHIWNFFYWHDDNLKKIFNTLLNKIGLLKAMFYAPLIYLSINNKIKSWAYNWFYIRVKNDIKSLVPYESLSKNVGIGDGLATSTKGNHKFSNIGLSDSQKKHFINGTISLKNSLGYSTGIIVLRIIYNWLRLIVR